MTKVIAYQTDAGVSIVSPTPEAVGEVGIDEIAKKDVPAGFVYKIMDINDFPLDGTFNEQGTPNLDKTFRAAWKMTRNKVAADLPKAREIAHERRRAKREDEFAPHDAAIAKQLPGNDNAEAERVKIRAKYDAMQTAIDAAKTPDELKAVLT